MQRNSNENSSSTLPKELLIDEDKILKLFKPLYALVDSGDYWGNTLTDHLRNELGMEVATENGA